MNSYGLSPDFELEVVYLTCTQPRFYSRIGKDILPDMLLNKNNQLLVQAAQEIGSKLKRGPRKAASIINKLTAKAKEWKLTLERIQELREHLDRVVEFGSLTEPDVEETIVVLAPYIEDQKLDSAEQAMFRAASRGGSIDDVISELRAAQTVGEENVEDSFMIGGSLDENIEINPRIERKMFTGIPALDLILGAGVQCGTLNLFVGDTGGGKTASFTQLTAASALSGLCGLYVTVEMAASLIDYRILSAITDVPEEEIRNNVKDARKIARARLAEFSLGSTKVVRMKGNPDMVTLKQLVTEHEQESGTELDYLVVDYLDLMEASSKKGMPIWQKNKLITRELEDFAEEKAIWVWSGTQTQESKQNRTQTQAKTVLDMAGGKEQSRGSSLVIGINLVERRSKVWLNLVKQRFGEGGLFTAEEATDFSFGRLTVPLNSWAIRNRIIQPTLVENTNVQGQPGA